MANILLESCCYPGLQYYTDQTNWTAATSAVTSVFSVTNDSTVLSGCYSIVSAFTSGFTSTSFIPNGVYTLQANCNTSICVNLGCCSNKYCVFINKEEYSGYTGTYTVSGEYNGYPFYTGGTQPGYIYKGTTKWCLGTAPGTDCFFFGQDPTSDVCPNLYTDLFYSGVCVTPTPTPSATSSSETRTATATSTTTSSSGTSTVSGLGGYAVIHPDGHVCGVIVGNSYFAGNDKTMTSEYMGCPVGSRIVFQTKASPDGNVAGWHGQNITYSQNQFTIKNDSGTATTVIQNGIATDSNGKVWDTGSGACISQCTVTTVSDSTTVTTDTLTVTAQFNNTNNVTASDSRILTLVKNYLSNNTYSSLLNKLSRITRQMNSWFL